jgi:hypothetical protein
MNEFTRGIFGFGAHVGAVDGIALCRMFNEAVKHAEINDLRRVSHCRDLVQLPMAA